MDRLKEGDWFRIPPFFSPSVSLMQNDGLAAGWSFVTTSTLEMQTDLGRQMQMKAPDGAVQLSANLMHLMYIMYLVSHIPRTSCT